MKELVEELASHIRLVWRHKWYAVIFAWIIALIGWSYVYFKPDRYEAFTQVFVDTQSVLRPLMSGIAVEANLDEMIKVMSKTLTSRPNLEKVVQVTGLVNEHMTDDEKENAIKQVAHNLSVTSGGKESLYSISFVHENPATAKRIVQAFLDIFVERSRVDKREDAASARQFIDEQLEDYRQRLKTSEDAVMAFKRRNLGLLPGEGPSYYTRLVETQTALNQAELELKEAENSAASIRAQLAVASRNPSAPKERIVVQTGKQESELDTRIHALEKKLDELRLIYTEQHPDIVALIPMIEQLKVRRAEEERHSLEQKKAVDASDEGKEMSKASDPVYQELTVALTKAEADVAKLQTRVNEYRRRYAKLQAVASEVPKVEAQYTQLTRDYEVNKARYDELLRRRENAQISGKLEETDAVMGFRVVDPPRLPLKPKGPNRPKLMTFVLLLALGGGGGVAWTIGQVRSTINEESDLKNATGLPVLGTVVLAWTEEQKKRYRRGIAGFIASIASLLSAYAAIMAMLFLTVTRA
jgi:polysaccharide chain length determinant protein (PEP-CTERM system associated)